MEHGHAHHSSHKWLYGATAATGVIAAPYLLPSLGFGRPGLTEAIARICSTTPGASLGLSGTLRQASESLPGIGSYVAEGGWNPAIASGILGFGGTWLGNFIHQHYDRKGHIPWGKIIKYVAITTSLLIALPGILSGLTMGATYLAYLVGSAALASSILGITRASLGLLGEVGTTGIGSGMSALLPHLATCGAAIVPFLGPLLMPKTHAAMGAAETDSTRYRMELVSREIPEKGKPCKLAFQLLDTKRGTTVSERDLARVHTRKLHSMIVDESLSDYHHLHPVYDRHSGLFVCEFTPASDAPYAAWHDFTPKQENHVIYERTALPSYNHRHVVPNITHTLLARVDGLNASILSNNPMRAGEDAMLSITLRDAGGRTVEDLEPIMGEFAHLVAFSRDGQHFIHCHPISATPEMDHDLGSGALQFHVTPEIAGGTKFFLQVMRQGKEITIPFGQMVLPPLQFQQKLAAAPHAQHLHRVG